MNYKRELNQILEYEKTNMNGYAKQWLTAITKKPYICLWGAGNHGKNWYRYLTELQIKVDFIGDNSKEALTKWDLRGGKLSTIEELIPLRSQLTIIIAVRQYKAIEVQLHNAGFDDIYIAPVEMFCFAVSDEYSGNAQRIQLMQENVRRLLDICEDDVSRQICLATVKKWFVPGEDIPYSDNQYFTRELVSLGKREDFVDVGAYDGDTIARFLEETGNQFGHIYAWEMDHDSCGKLKDRIAMLDGSIKERIVIYSYGAWDEEKTMHYIAAGTNSVLTAGEGETAVLMPLDKVLFGKKVTFIKMDIEGAEMHALRGAEKIIKENLPTLAICTYHRATDLWEIPFYIKQLSPQYAIYFRHHEHSDHETVCYALHNKQ